MIEANEINSTFYALRLLSHRIDTSEIEVTDGEEYPASEFTREEQEQALNIIHGIEQSESASSNQLPQDKIDFYVAALANRIEELANSDLANAGYAVETATISTGHLTQGEVAIASPKEEETIWAMAEELGQLVPPSSFRSEFLAPTLRDIANPEDLLRAHELLNAILNIIPNPLRREAFLARFLHGSTYEEIATKLKVNKSTVRQWLVRDRRKLRQLLFASAVSDKHETEAPSE